MPLRRRRPSVQTTGPGEPFVGAPSAELDTWRATEPTEPELPLSPNTAANACDAAHQSGSGCRCIQHAYAHVRLGGVHGVLLSTALRRCGYAVMRLAGLVGFCRVGLHAIVRTDIAILSMHASLRGFWSSCRPQTTQTRQWREAQALSLWHKRRNEDTKFNKSESKNEGNVQYCVQSKKLLSLQ